MSIAFDELTPADVEEIARVHIQCWQESYAGLLPDEFLKNLSIDEKIAQWRQTVSDPLVFTRVARDARRIVGFVSCGAAREGAAKGADGEILAIYILKAYHGRRIGRSLMAAAARFWLSKGGRNLVVLSMAGNNQAAAFYKALGGLRVDEGSFEIAGTRIDDTGHLFNNLAELAALP
ncbi:MAG: GNAT family N-acetyltransferase [Aestuariivirga sp.]|nr:GNAT family N-acetyltransferase [Hyphomicrobiales bacterium]